MSAPITSTKARAAVLYDHNGPFVIEEFELEAPRAGEVLVRIVATGMCHTDAAVRSGDLPTPLPVVLGHEGAGVVESVGAGVRKVAAGDHVVISVNSCGQCDSCLSGHPSICHSIFPLNFAGARFDGSHALTGGAGRVHDQFFGQSSFATRALAHERNVVKVPSDVPLELLGPLACGIQTGAGSVLNALRVGPGESFAVFGSGAVGLSAVMAARVGGATTIIAVDVLPARLELARELGATHVVNGRECDAVAEIQKITRIGVKHALDTTGNVNVIRGAIEALRMGGVCGILGASAAGAELSFPVSPFMSMSKSLRGIIEGDSVPDIFIPQLIELYRQGRFPFDKLLRFYALEDINQALADSEKGLTVKPVIRMPV
jgi:aryl-alcohol dehydrogenase